MVLGVWLFLYNSFDSINHLHLLNNVHSGVVVGFKAELGFTMVKNTKVRDVLGIITYYFRSLF